MPSVRHWLRGLLPGGIWDTVPGRWWIRRRARQAEQAYRAALVADAARTPAPRAEADAAAPLVRGRALRRLVLVTDLTWERQGLLPELERLADVEVVDVAARSPGSPAALRDRVLATLRALPSAAAAGPEPDLVLAYLRPQLLSEELLAELRRRWKAPLLGMNLDDKVQFFPGQRRIDENVGFARWAPRFDAVLTSCRYTLDAYRAAGARPVYLPGGFVRDPRWRVPASGPWSHRVGFLGSAKPERVDLVRWLEANGLPVRVAGSGWPGAGPVEDAAGFYRSQALTLGLGWVSASAELTSLKVRDFECPGSGAAYLATYDAELAACFEPGREILLWGTRTELVELLAWYGRRPEACAAIAAAGHRRAWAEHGWATRLVPILRDLGWDAREREPRAP